MKTTLKNIAKSILFCTILVCLLVTASKAFEPRNKKVEGTMMAPQAKAVLSEREMSLDAVVVGDSLTYTSISPMEIWRKKGIPMYVCGTSAQRMNLSEQIVETVLKVQNPKVILLEVNGLYRAPKLKYYVYDALQDYISIIKYHNRWKNYSKDMKGGSDISAEGTFKGFKINGRCKSYASRGGDDASYSKGRRAIPKYNLDHLDVIRRNCDKAGVKLLLVSTPSKVNWRIEKHNAIQDYADKYGLDFYDMNYGERKVNIDWAKETLDGGDHLNYLGAKKVTETIGAYLAEKYGMKDRRGEKAYEGWNKIIEKYDMEIKRKVSNV